MAATRMNELPTLAASTQMAHGGESRSWKPLTEIRIGRYQFWVKLDGHSLWVVAAKSATGFTFLKAETDGDEPNGLLRLPECP